MSWLESLSNNALGSGLAPSQIDATMALAKAMSALALAINRLAATQEKPKSKGAVSFTTAHFEDEPDAQTAQLRDLSRQRGEGGEE